MLKTRLSHYLNISLKMFKKKLKNKFVFVDLRLHEKHAM